MIVFNAFAIGLLIYGLVIIAQDMKKKKNR